MVSIVALGTSIPEFVATNDYVVSLALEQSRKSYLGDLTQLEHDLHSFLRKAGSKERRWRTGFSTPAEHIGEAWENCLAKLGTEEKAKIGTLIYCGIDRGVAEPSHASLFANRFGLFDVRCLDVSDACMGWYTATKIAGAFATDAKPFCAIISAEFPLEMPGKVYPTTFTIRNADDLLWKGAGLTLGEAASVTIIDALVSDHPVFKSNARHADVCCVPLVRPDRFVDSRRLLPKLNEDCFVAHLPTMVAATYRDATDVLESYVSRNGKPDVVLPHTVSQSGPLHASRHLLSEGTIKNCFEFFGNIATSSIPVGYEYFSCDFEHKFHIAAWISAAGMSHCAFRLT